MGIDSASGGFVSDLRYLPAFLVDLGGEGGGLLINSEPPLFWSEGGGYKPPRHRRCLSALNEESDEFVELW